MIYSGRSTLSRMPTPQRGSASSTSWHSIATATDQADPHRQRSLHRQIREDSAILNIDTLIQQRSRASAGPKTGMRDWATVTVLEVRGASAVLREYPVTETIGSVTHRKESFACTGYLNLQNDADAKARALGSSAGCGAF